MGDGPDVSADVVNMMFSPDANVIAVGSIDTVIRVWGVVTGTLVDRLRGHRASVCFTPDGKGLVSGSIDQTFRIWELNTAAAGEGGAQFGKCLLEFSGNGHWVHSVAIWHDGR